MANSLNKIRDIPTGVSAPQPGKLEAVPGSGATQKAEGSFQKFIIANPLKEAGVLPLISPAQHQAARRRLFDRLVRKVLNDKAHPFSGLDGELKQDMIASITEELVQSHYKV